MMLHFVNAGPEFLLVIKVKWAHADAAKEQ